MDKIISEYFFLSYDHPKLMRETEREGGGGNGILVQTCGTLFTSPCDDAGLPSVRVVLLQASHVGDLVSLQC